MIKADRNNNVVTISILSERFIYRSNQEFREAFNTIDDPNVSYVVDLGKVIYIDSAAVAMLLMLHHHVGGDVSRVTLANCCDSVSEVLDISKVKKLFTII